MASVYVTPRKTKSGIRFRADRELVAHVTAVFRLELHRDDRLWERAGGAFLASCHHRGITASAVGTPRNRIGVRGFSVLHGCKTAPAYQDASHGPRLFPGVRPK